MSQSEFYVRPAIDADLAFMAKAHRASILEIGSEYYDAESVAIWGRERDPDKYREAQAQGELYFVAVRPQDERYILGFSSYLKKEEKHRLQALYVRGTEARRGVGTALY